MNPEDISTASNPDLSASLAAMQRAAALARKIAIQTDTAIIVMEDGELRRIPAATLRQQLEPRPISDKLRIPDAQSCLMKNAP